MTAECELSCTLTHHLQWALEKEPKRRILRRQQIVDIFFCDICLGLITGSFFAGNEPPDNPHLKNSYFLEEEAELEKKRNLFEQERAAFEQVEKIHQNYIAICFVSATV